MKYVLLGNLSPEWASKQSERIGKAKAKLDKLGIKIESIHYTQGYYDFVDIVDAPNQEAMLAFSVWYSTQGLGGSKVCRPSTQRASKPRSRTQRAKRRVMAHSFPANHRCHFACASSFFPGALARSAEPEEAVGKLLIRGERLRSRMCGSHGVELVAARHWKCQMQSCRQTSQRRQHWTSPSRVMMLRMGQKADLVPNLTLE